MTAPSSKHSLRSGTSTGFAIDYPAFASGMRAFGLRLASDAEIRAGVAIAQDLVGQTMVPAAKVEEVQTYTGCAAWVCGDAVDGVLLLVALSEAGELAVRHGIFDPAAGVAGHYCEHGQPCFGVYVGVYAGRTRDARRSLMQGCAATRISIFGQVPCFARAATEDGARSMASLGFRAADFGARDLWVQEPLTGSKRKVA